MHTYIHTRATGCTNTYIHIYTHTPYTRTYIHTSHQVVALRECLDHCGGVGSHAHQLSTLQKETAMARTKLSQTGQTRIEPLHPPVSALAAGGGHYLPHLSPRVHIDQTPANR